MSVGWHPRALEDRTDLLDKALERAIEKPDPQIYMAAEEQDLQIEAEGNALDGVATYQSLPGMPGTHVYTGSNKRWVILYKRTAQHVEIERVLPSRTNWKPS